MDLEVLTGEGVVAGGPSLVIGPEHLVPSLEPVKVAAVRRHHHAGVYATSDGVLFKNFVPMREASDGKKTLSNRILGLRWSYIRNAYRKSVWFCTRHTDIDSGYWVTDNLSSNYYHWFCEVFPKLYLLAQCDTAVTIILPHDLQRRSFVAGSIDSLGFEHVIFIDHEQSVKVKNLYTINSPSPKNMFRADVLSGMRILLRNHFGITDDGDGHDRVYISRHSAKKRRVTNEDEIRDVLTAHGFRVVEMENLDFEDQVKLMISCKYLVAGHGAGLTNMLFMKAGGAVMEVRERRNPPCFVSLASALGHRHYSLHADTVHTQRSANWGDVRIDPVQLDSAVERMFD